MKTEIEIAAQIIQIEECDRLINEHQEAADRFIDLRIKMAQNLESLKDKLKSEI